MTQTAPRAETDPAAEHPAAGIRGGSGWLCGLIGGVAGMAVADFGAYVIAPAGAPLTAVGSMIINLLPAGLVNWGKDTLGVADKPVLLVLVAVGVLVLCGVAGRLEQRRPYAGLPVFAGVAVIGIVAELTSGHASLPALLPTFLGLAIGYLVLRILTNRLAGWSAATETAGPQERAVARRTFLLWTAVAGGVAVAGAVTGRLLMTTAGAVQEIRSRFQLPTPIRRDPIPGDADLGVDGLSPYVTPNVDFYRIDTALQLPIIRADAWSLKITGMVEREVTISFADLIAKPLVEHVATLTCVSNEIGGDLVGNAVWLGYPIRELLAQAGVQPGADMVLSTSQDGWTAGTPLAVLTDPDRQALLAVGMNGEALPVEHGYPVRMVVPGLYGYVSATKWVRELKVTTFAADQGYWTPLGWSAKGPIKTGSRIDVPRKRTVDAGQVVIAGVAWDQHTGIEKVEVGIDDVWHPAQLAEVTGPDTWRQWLYRWEATPGTHEVAVRATNADGEQQTAELARPDPDGATGWHTVAITVR
ncbi:MAG: molybdopterin-dependent oxidoreductase [Microlunatus sp.]